MKRFIFALAAVIGLLAAPLAASPAAASPIPYSVSNAPGDTPQTLVAALIANLNTNLPTAATNQTAAATAGAATLNGLRGTVTSESLTTAAGAIYTLTLSNTSVTAASQVLVSVGQGTNTTDGPTVMTVTPSANSVVIKVKNTHSATALNGTITVSFMVVN